MRARAVLLSCGLALAAASSASGAAAKDGCLRYGSAKTVVVGLIYAIDDQGPDPEKDATQTFLGLTMNEPVCVKAGRRRAPGERDEYRLGMIELRGAEAMVPAGLLGQLVRVTGALRHAASDEDRSPVLMTVRSVQPLKPAK